MMLQLRLRTGGHTPSSPQKKEPLWLFFVEVRVSLVTPQENKTVTIVWAEWKQNMATFTHSFKFQSNHSDVLT